MSGDEISEEARRSLQRGYGLFDFTGAAKVNISAGLDVQLQGMKD
jgi:hypothetical protein